MSKPKINGLFIKPFVENLPNGQQQLLHCLYLSFLALCQHRTECFRPADAKTSTFTEVVTVGEDQLIK